MDATALQPIIAQTVGKSDGPLSLLFAMLLGHALADYPLQGKFLAIQKNRHIKLADYNEQAVPTLWVYCLTAHSMVHALTVWIILGVFGLPYAALMAFAELALHWIIDFAKCEKWTNFHQDQGLHLVCKTAYVLVYWLGLGVISL